MKQRFSWLAGGLFAVGVTVHQAIYLDIQMPLTQLTSKRRFNMVRDLDSTQNPTVCMAIYIGSLSVFPSMANHIFHEITNSVHLSAEHFLQELAISML